jgi:hypothetical protein
MLEVTGVGIHKVFSTKSVKKIFWDHEFVSDVHCIGMSENSGV